MQPVDGGDVRVVERGEELGLALEPLQSAPGRRRTPREDLESPPRGPAWWCRPARKTTLIPTSPGGARRRDGSGAAWFTGFAGSRPWRATAGTGTGPPFLVDCQVAPRACLVRIVRQGRASLCATIAFIGGLGIALLFSIHTTTAEARSWLFAHCRRRRRSRTDALAFS